jgi:hypothetical protein
MTTFIELFPSRFIKADDLNGNTLNVTVKHLAVEGIGPKKDKKPVIYFQEDDRGMVLNKRNGCMLRHLSGSENLDDWSGLTIQLRVEMVPFQGVHAVRIGEETTPGN